MKLTNVTKGEVIRTITESQKGGSKITQVNFGHFQLRTYLF